MSKNTKPLTGIAQRTASRLLEGMSPELAYALGASKSTLSEKDAVARLLVAEGLGEFRQWSPHVTRDGSYLSESTLAKLLSEVIEARIAEAFPDEPAAPEPVVEQPTAPVPVPDLPPLPWKSAATTPLIDAAAMQALTPDCASCGKPQAGIACADCNTKAGIPDDVVESMRKEAAARSDF